MLEQTVDIVAYGPDGQLVLMADIVNIRRTTTEWASKFRCNLLANGFMPQNTFFLFATPDRFYLWKNRADQAEQYEPDYEIDATPFFRPIFERIGLKPDTVDRYAFEMIVTSLLGNLVYRRNGTEDCEPLANALLNRV